MYSPIFQKQVELLRALANERRLEIVQLLSAGELSVSAIYSMLDLPQANISQHLKVLRGAGIVLSRRDSKQVLYRLADPQLAQITEQLREWAITHVDGSHDDALARVSLIELVPLVHDPVCGMQLSPRTASFSAKYQAQPYYFCASGCLVRFQQHPTKYVLVPSTRTEPKGNIASRNQSV